jgi:hypothetical protein
MSFKVYFTMYPKHEPGKLILSQVDVTPQHWNIATKLKHRLKLAQYGEYKCISPFSNESVFN